MENNQIEMTEIVCKYSLEGYCNNKNVKENESCFNDFITCQFNTPIEIMIN